MWGRKYCFLEPFFFLSGPFQGGYFFGKIIYLAALDLRPVTLNLRPARLLAKQQLAGCLAPGQVVRARLAVLWNRRPPYTRAAVAGWGC
jgi:hypothetical protein